MSSNKIFAPRTHILSWINRAIQIPINKIQQLGSGVVYCLLLDAAFPNRVPLHKLKWFAITQVQYLHNFKVLQTSFVHLGIDKKIEIVKLVRAKQQDNLQFIQWMKWFLEDRIQSNFNYDPVKRRNYQNVYLQFNQNKILQTPHMIHNKMSSLPKNQIIYKKQKINKKRPYELNKDFMDFQNFQQASKNTKTVESDTDFYGITSHQMSHTFDNFDLNLKLINKQIQAENASNKQNTDENNFNIDINTIKTPKNTIKRMYFPQRFSQRLRKRVNLKDEAEMTAIKIQQLQQFY